ncbi:ATP-binding cassette domain-containing protein [Acinetobacter haemolyticus]|jgi:molybdate transport system ATP-binding protein|uniref:ATP-binding cassette domain-containing protein n=1 Tax=unclassified Acinetobacter TaxID=196816 RepID=UPI0015D3F85C|nr:MULTISPECIES: ATP-binding cassette domain-containing protein [unclassified Acinetobacter]MDD2946294.1 ATP-binding cassette domain-containing protein [Acinetobacter sp.]UDM37263.1 ATP-binding cassette domain-containing protein [Acinetobacter haemolyticus]
MLKCDFLYQQGDFSLNVELEMQQQLLGIVGASGSGKSTLLKNIVGLLKPQQGYIQLNEQLLIDTRQNIHIPMYQRKIALIFQHALLFPHMNVQQNLRYAEKLVDKSERKFQFDDIVELLDLTTLIQRKAHQLSGGEAQRVSIGRALLSSPHLLLLDEPLTGLDRSLKQQILPFFKRIKEELDLPVIYVTHHPEELEYLEAETLQLSQGQLQRNSMDCG